MNLDISSAKLKHMNWKMRLRSFLAGKETLTMDQVCNHTECDLGKWIYSEQSHLYASTAVFRELEFAHKGLHGMIRAIVDMKLINPETDCNDMMKSFEKQSQRIMELLDALAEETK